MNSIGCIAFTKAGCELAARIACELAAMPAYAGASFSMCGPARFAGEVGIDAYESLSSWTAARFADDDALVFVGASGIAVRAIAPHVKDKFSDPAVVSVDEAGRFVVPLLSGHVGGANALARDIAAIVGGQAVVSTATDVNGLFAVDEWASGLGLQILERDIAKEISGALLEGRVVGFASDFELDWQLPDGVTDGLADIGFAVTLDVGAAPFGRTLHLVPRIVTVGVGCRKGVDPQALRETVFQALAQAGVSSQAVRTLASIDVKGQERAIIELARAEGWELRFYSADELAAVPGDFAQSDFVERTVGVGNVCERAACAEGGTLLLGKQAHDGSTVALGIASWPE